MCPKCFWFSVLLWQQPVLDGFYCFNLFVDGKTCSELRVSALQHLLLLVLFNIQQFSRFIYQNVELLLMRRVWTREIKVAQLAEQIEQFALQLYKTLFVSLWLQTSYLFLRLSDFSLQFTYSLLQTAKCKLLSAYVFVV